MIFFRAGTSNLLIWKVITMNKSFKSLALAVFAVTLASSAMAAGSELEVGYKSVDYTGGFSNGSSQFINYKQTLDKGYVAASLTQLDLFDHTANLYSVWGSYNLSANHILSGSFTTSDRGLISAKNRGGVSFGVKLPQNYIVSVGVDSFNMRNNSHSDGLTAQVVKYVQTIPLVVQASATYRVNNPGTHGASSSTFVATYGHEKDWTLTGGLAFGDANYETTTAIPAYANYSVNRQFVQYRKWVATDWGFNAQVDMSQTKFFDRNELGLSVFHSF